MVRFAFFRDRSLKPSKKIVLHHGSFSKDDRVPERYYPIYYPINGVLPLFLQTAPFGIPALA